MLTPKFREWSRATLGVCLSTLLALPNPALGQPNDHHKTDTPIKHVIVLIGENRSFDNLEGRISRRTHLVEGLNLHVVGRAIQRPAGNGDKAGLKAGALPRSPNPQLQIHSGA
jgi:phospholipase C